MVCFKVAQVERKQDEVNPKIEATAIAVYHVSGSVDCCRVGFLRRHLLKYKDKYDGKLDQVTKVFNDESESPSD